jgi:hypothetical protein
MYVSLKTFFFLNTYNIEQGIIFKTITSVYVQMTELETYMLEMQALIMLMLRANRQHVLSLRQKKH